MNGTDLQPLLLSIRLATVTTGVLLLLGTPLAWWLARTDSRLRAPIEAVVAMPLVLPPTVLGFYLRLVLGPDGPIGGPWRLLGGGPLVFSFTGLVVGSVVYSLPFVVQPLQDAPRTFVAHVFPPREMVSAASRSDASRPVIPIQSCSAAWNSRRRRRG